jgi:hypothetical protein
MCYTAGGVSITRRRTETPYEGAIEAYVEALDSGAAACFPPTTNIPAATRAGTPPSSIRRWSITARGAPCASRR